MIDYYSLLKISKDSDRNTILKMYHQFRESVSKYNGGLSKTDDELKSEFPDIVEAYETLLDEESRKIYNEKLKHNLSFKGTTNYQGGGDSLGVSPARNYTRTNLTSGTAETGGPVYIVRYRVRQWLITSTRIISYVGFALTGLLTFVLLIVAILYKMPVFLIMKFIIYIVSISALLLLLYNFDKFLKWIFPPKEIHFKHKSFFIVYGDGREFPVKEIVLYKYLISDILFINIFTEEGRNGFYKSLDSFYRLEVSREEIKRFGQKAGIPVREKLFLFINHLLEKPARRL